eukprot:12381131-Ditylum_brightwellii.AAC.1
MLVVRAKTLGILTLTPPPLKDAERHAKKCGLSTKEVKNFNVFVKDKVDKIIKECDCNMHAMSKFKDMLISSSNKSFQSILNDTSIEGSNNEDCKLTTKK